MEYASNIAQVRSAQRAVRARTTYAAIEPSTGPSPTIRVVSRRDLRHDVGEVAALLQLEPQRRAEAEALGQLRGRG